MPDTDMVTIGADGHLFLTGGQHSVQAYFRGEKRPSDASVRTFFDNAATRDAFCRQAGLGFLTCVFPEKIYALRDHLPGGGAEIRSLYLSAYDGHPAAQADLPVVYPSDLLDGRPEAFLRTDTHYSAAGAVAIARRLLARDLDAETLDAFDRITGSALTARPAFCGDLGRKFDPPRTEAARVLRRASLPPMETASNGIQSGNDGLMILQRSGKALTGKTLVIFGDSFFRQLLPLLSVAMRKVVFCRTRFFHYELIDALAPDLVYCGLAERYLSRCDPDAERPHFLAYPYARGKIMRPDDGLAKLWPRFFKGEKLL